MNCTRVNSTNSSWVASCELANLIASSLKLSERQQHGLNRFSLFSKNNQETHAGISRVDVSLDDDSGLFAVRCELVSKINPGQKNLRRTFLDLLLTLDRAGSGIAFSLSPSRTLWADFTVRSGDLDTFASSAGLAGKLRALDDIARGVADLFCQSPLSAVKRSKLFDKFRGVLAPVTLAPGLGADLSPELPAWARDIVGMMRSGLSVALRVTSGPASDIALSAVAAAFDEQRLALGELVLPQLPTARVLELVQKSPGPIAIPATCLTVGANRYEQPHEVENLLRSLEAGRNSVIFFGHEAALQTLLHGGQGGAADPLRPVVRSAPNLTLKTLASFCIQRTVDKETLPAEQVESLVADVLQALAAVPHDAHRLVAPICARATQDLGETEKPLAEFTRQLAGEKESFVGLRVVKSRLPRKPHVEARFREVLLSPDLHGYFAQQLVGQTQALRLVDERVKSEVLARPSWQPVRMLLLGGPATGKSECTRLLAERLGVPYESVDCAAFADHYTATSMLKGSARGIVGSFDAGRLEMASKTPDGAVVELMDLDHAPASVRSVLGDIFLQALDAGCARSSTGAPFSVANLVFVFTVNLPGNRADLLGRPPLGFRDGPNDEETQQQAVAELKDVFSNALLSRLGSPIVFRPLGAPALATIVEREMVQALARAAQRMGIDVGAVRCVTGAGQRLIESCPDGHAHSFGARAVLELARSSAVREFLKRVHSMAPAKGLRIDVTSGGETNLEEEG